MIRVAIEVATGIGIPAALYEAVKALVAGLTQQIKKLETEIKKLETDISKIDTQIYNLQNVIQIEAANDNARAQQGQEAMAA